MYRPRRNGRYCNAKGFGGLSADDVLKSAPVFDLDLNVPPSGWFASPEGGAELRAGYVRVPFSDYRYLC